MEICSRGYRLDDGWLTNIDKNFLWIYVKGQAALRMLFDMETDPDAKEAFLAGLRANASNAFKVVGDYKLYDNSANYPFTSSDWRRIYKWRPQKSQKDAEETGNDAVELPFARKRKKDGKKLHDKSHVGRRNARIQRRPKIPGNS